jgi:polar amino acid transport system substrate-binding protein
MKEMKMKQIAAVAFAAMVAGTLSITALAGCGDSSSVANTVTSAEDLVGKTIGVQLGTTGQYAAEDVEGATVEKYNKGVDAVQALKQGKVDAVIIDLEPAKVFVSKNDDLQILDEDFVVEDYAIAVAKDNTELKDAINTALAELKEDGTLQQIQDNWIGDNAGETPYESPEDVSRENGKLVMATNAEFPPYESMEGSEIVGYDVDMMQAVCDKLGYELSIENMEFDSVITAVQTGKAQVGVAGITVNEDREKNVSFTDSYATSHQVIIVRK